MKALVYNGAYDISCESVAEPQIRDGQDVIVKVSLCSICGSDLHIFHGHAEKFAPGTGFCVGHEAVGEVVECGPLVHRLKVGDRVMLPGSIGCGECRNCLRGNVRACLNGKRAVFGLGHDLPGSQAEFVRVPVGDYNLGAIPEGVSDEQALMLTDAQATAWLACRNADIVLGSTVVVIGLGPIGLMAVETAFVKGAARVFAVDPITHRRALAEGLGAQALSPDAALEFITEATDGRLADSVIEAVGSDATVTMALKLVRMEGTVSVIGVNHNMQFPFPLGAALSRGITFRAWTTSVAETWPELVPLVQQGRLNPAQFITNHIPLAEGADAYRLLDSRADGVVKAVIIP